MDRGKRAGRVRASTRPGPVAGDRNLSPTLIDINRVRVASPIVFEEKALESEGETSRFRSHFPIEIARRPAAPH